jgi:hypothetical protein
MRNMQHYYQILKKKLVTDDIRKMEFALGERLCNEFFQAGWLCAVRFAPLKNIERARASHNSAKQKPRKRSKVA